ncbi:MAG: hypothetical protein KDE54_19245, partial [Caldilineaceae bacterium]|nr:hypothetical protein [Caldilineaceae bacterium]
ALLADDVDSDADAAGQTAAVTIASGQRYASLDVGAYIPLQIGAQIWFDANNNGRVDARENGLAGVVVQLTDLQNRLIATATTTADGAYLFENLPAGSYAVLLPPLNFADGGPLFGYLSSTGHAGDLQERTADAAKPIADVGIDSLQPADTGIRSSTLRLQAASDADQAVPPTGDHRTAAPFGFYKPLNIGNRLWLDGNNNGHMDAAEPGLDNVLIYLYRDDDGDGQPDGAALRQQMSAYGGYYLFDNLGAGQYVIQFPANNFQADGALAGMASSAPGLDDWVETAPLTQTVWVDAVDGQDDGRNTYTPWLDGVRSGTIELVAEEQPLGETDQLAGTGSIVTDANSNLTVDFGFYKPLSLSSRIWLDLDNNGQFDSQEEGIENVTLLLYADADQDGAPEGNPLMQTVTGPNGDYLFWGLLPGGYVAEVAAENFAADGVLSHFHLSGSDVITPESGLVHSPPVWLADDNLSMQGASANPGGQSVQDVNRLNIIDLGFYKPVEVSGRIWLDGNANGIQDVDETSGPANIEVTLYSVNAQTGSRAAINFTRTDATGHYEFAQLLPGTYAVTFDVDALVQAGYVATQPNAVGIDGLRNSDADSITGETAATAFLFSGSTAAGMDMGVYVPATLGDLVWLDTNINGIYEPERGEKGAPNVRVVLFAADSNTPLADPNNPNAPWSSVTDINGRYQFSG